MCKTFQYKIRKNPAKSVLHPFLLILFNVPINTANTTIFAHLPIEIRVIPLGFRVWLWIISIYGGSTRFFIFMCKTFV